jgi:UDP-glucose 4-epimerase
VQYSIDFPIETNEVNVTGTLNILFASKNSGVKRVVFSNSSSIYGDQDKLPFVETMQVNPKSPYGLQKYFGGLYMKMFSTIYKLETVSLCYFNVYGPNQDPTGGYAQAIPKFIFQKKNKKPLTVTGDGEQRRDNTNVSDVVNANMLAMKSTKVGNGEVINIGSGKNSSVNEIARMIGGEIEYIPARLEPKETLADISLAKKLLNWEPKVSLSQGLAELKKLNGI